MGTFIRVVPVIACVSVLSPSTGGAQDLVVAPDPKDLQLVLGGESSAGFGDAGNSAAGLVGLRFIRQGDYSAHALLHVGNQRMIADVGQAKVGTYLLNPQVEGVGAVIGGSKDVALPVGRLDLQVSAGASSADIRGKSGDLAEMNVFHWTVAVEWMTRTYRWGRGAGKLGVATGYTRRALVSDLAEDQRTEFRRSNIGTADTSFSDVFVEIFLLGDDVRPFVRFNSFEAPGVIGLDGVQPVVGITVLRMLF